MLNNKRALAAAIFLAWLPLIISAAYPAVWQWSESAGSNASADPSINWREGQPPSSVNDSARAMMAALAGYRDDISGLLTTTGTASAYLVSTNQILPNPPNDGQQLSVTVNITNGIAPTLSADGGGAFAIQSSAANAVAPGSLIQGSPYTFRFSVANNAWMLQGFFGSALTVPLGGMIPYTLSTVPNSNFVFPAGQCISTTTYATYWVALGSPASGTCSGGQFKIIDMSGTVPAGLDTMPGFSAANRLTSSATGCGTAMTSVGARCANGGESFTIINTNLPPYTPQGGLNASITVNGGTALGIISGTGQANIQSGSGTTQFSPGSFQQLTANTPGWTGTPAPGHNSTPVAKVMPAIGVTYLLRVL